MFYYKMGVYFNIRRLSIDPLSGAIKIKSSQPLFDREQVSRHYLTIEARDDLGHGNR